MFPEASAAMARWDRSAAHSDKLVVVIFLGAWTLLLHFFSALVRDTAPETIGVLVAQIREHEMQPILCLKEGEVSERLICGMYEDLRTWRRKNWVASSRSSGGY